jgi:hypothetical protein
VTPAVTPAGIAAASTAVTPAGIAAPFRHGRGASGITEFVA